MKKPKKTPAQLSREIAASLASNVKAATPRLPGTIDGAALAEVLPAYKGWAPAWEYPGFSTYRMNIDDGMSHENAIDSARQNAFDTVELTRNEREMIKTDPKLYKD